MPSSLSCIKLSSLKSDHTCGYHLSSHPYTSQSYRGTTEILFNTLILFSHSIKNINLLSIVRYARNEIIRSSHHSFISSLRIVGKNLRILLITFTQERSV